MNSDFEIEIIGHLYYKNLIGEIYDGENLVARLSYENGPDKIICEIHEFNREILLSDLLETIKKTKKRLINE